MAQDESFRILALDPILFKVVVEESSPDRGPVLVLAYFTPGHASSRL